MRHRLRLGSLGVSVLAGAGILAALAPIPRLLAQSPPVVSPGALVRVVHTAPCCRSPVIGTLVSIEPNALRIVPELNREAIESPVILARTVVVSVDVGQRIAHRGSGTGLLVGLGAGAALGTVADGGRPGLGTIGGALLGTVLGLITGTVIASTKPDYEWHHALLPP